jgi:hypothetical protein
MAPSQPGLNLQTDRPVMRTFLYEPHLLGLPELFRELCFGRPVPEQVVLRVLATAYATRGPDGLLGCLDGSNRVTSIL